MIFVNSMSDLFHENAPEDAVVQIWKKIMEKASWHTFQVLTKRPERMCKLIDELRLKTLPNLWLGTSIENKDVLHRIDALKNIAAYIKFISFEPLIGPVTTVDLRLVDWVIVGGESGPQARPMHPEWARTLRDQCTAAGVPFFFKQWGGRTPKAGGRILDGEIHDEMPQRSAS